MEVRLDQFENRLAQQLDRGPGAKELDRGWIDVDESSLPMYGDGDR